MNVMKEYKTLREWNLRAGYVLENETTGLRYDVIMTTSGLRLVGKIFDGKTSNRYALISRATSETEAEYKTLEQWNVKEGDVVKHMLSGRSHTIYMGGGAPRVSSAVSVSESTDLYALISRADQPEPPIWGDMTATQRGEILLAQYEGRAVQFETCGCWSAKLNSCFSMNVAYRVKPPEPPEPTVRIDRAGGEIMTDEPKRFNCNSMADHFVELIKEHHDEADDAGSFAELMEYVLTDVIMALQRNGYNAPEVIWKSALKKANAMQSMRLHAPIEVAQGIYDADPELDWIE